MEIQKQKLAIHMRWIEQGAVAFVAAALLAGLGALGWLIGHMGAYDLLAHVFGIATHTPQASGAHHYLSVVEHAGLIFMASGMVLAALLLTAASPSLAAHLRVALSTYTATAAALIVPTMAFVVVENAEGSVAQYGPLLLLVGMPLQGVLGLLVVRAVRILLRALADVVEQLTRKRGLLLPHVAAAGVAADLPIPVLARCPMASCAPRRGPPRLLP